VKGSLLQDVAALPLWEAHPLGTLLLSLGLLIGAARVLGELARRWHQPAVLGELLAGVLLGPTVLGQLAPHLQQALFPGEGKNAVALDSIGTLAIVLFLLVAGLEVDLSVVWRQGRSALKVAVLGTVVPFLVGLAGAIVIPTALGRQADADPTIFALFLATAMAISALPVIAKTLMDLDLYRTDLGMVVVSAAIFNDVIGWTVFALILGLMGTSGPGPGIGTTIALTLVYAGLMLTVGRWAIHRLLPRLQAYTHWPGGVLGFAVTIALLGAAFTEFIGIHAIFGSFIVGVALGSSTHLQERTRVLLDEFVSFIFAPLFFASIGLRVNFATHFDLSLVTLVLALGTVGKLLGAVLGARWGGFRVRDRWAIAFAMNARGAMEIILGLLALEAGIIRQRLFVALVVMAIVTSALSGPLIAWTLRHQQPHRLLSLLNSRLFQRNLQGATPREVIHELALMASEVAGIPAEQIEAVAWRRETVAPTGIGHGLALPHARLANLKQPLVVVGLSEAGVDFDAPDGQPAHAVFLLLTPEDDPALQLELSADIAHMFRDPRCLDRVSRAANYVEFLAVLKTLAPQ
jgi:Kef-type K+ transport system membrane component KefB/mannitol/fructose-specific phosphotransferase system IIA component (Ntr-type)